MNRKPFVKRIVTALTAVIMAIQICNGTVTICSTIGEGTEITIHIPV